MDIQEMNLLNKNAQKMMFRQGDILFTRVSNNDVDMKNYDVIPESKTVALGELTGHDHHFTPQSQILLFKDKKSSSMDPSLVQITGQEGAALVHQEHSAIVMPEGVYQITREQEYNPFSRQLQRTAD